MIMNRRIASSIGILIFALAAPIAQVNAEVSPRTILEDSRALPPVEAVRLLERNLAGSGDLRSWYLLELAERASVDGNWKKSLEWSRMQAMESLPEAIADRVYYRYSEALMASGEAKKGNELLLSRLESGKARDALLWLAYFRSSGMNDGSRRITVENLVSRLDAANPSLKDTDAESYALSRYLAGLSAVRSGEWDFAARSFGAFSPFDGRYPEYAPWSRFYLAWSHYRLGRWKAAIGEFSYYLDTWKNHDRSWQAAMAAALSSIQSGGDALGFAERAVRLAPTNAERAESLIFEASILTDRNDSKGAEELLSRVTDGSSTGGITPSAPRALFMLADAAFRQGKPELAEERWLSLSDRFPKNSLSGEALFRAGEQWYIAGVWPRSAELFSRYRKEWPAGGFLDAALRMGADAYRKSGNTALAILWWEELLRKFPDNPAAGRTYADLVDAYRSDRDYAAALRAAEEYRKRFPAEASLDGIGDAIDELKLLSRGEDGSTAALLSSWDKQGRAATSSGRSAGLALARRYLADYRTRGDARGILSEIIARSPKSPDALSAADRGVYAAAWSLWGNILREESAHKAASSALLAAGNFWVTLDGERSAEALYGAADSFLQSGSRADAVKTVETLKKAWPGSAWTRRADILLQSAR